MPPQHIPRVEFGVCGGSGSLSREFPAALSDDRVEVLAEDLTFDTPFGRSPAFTHFRVDGSRGVREALAIRMHGWRRGVKRARIPIPSPRSGTRLVLCSRATPAPSSSGTTVLFVD